MSNFKNKILFVCSRNKWHSLTAEKIFENFGKYEVRSAGTEKGARIKITPGLVSWADLIFVMEKKHSQVIKHKFDAELAQKKVICLNIPDEFQYMDEELVELLKGRLSEYIEVPD